MARPGGRWGDHDEPRRHEPWWPDWVRLRDLIERSRADEARRLARELAEKWPRSETLQHDARVLEVPTVRVLSGVSGRSLDADYAWIREHAHEHPGCWLALHRGRLITADPEVRRAAAAADADPEQWKGACEP